ncbi:ArsI/CadI family heavy metal resistance metalloenzyme [Pseudotenacibaculum sp. MALMAid0570]|uniref:ArsI/CadI family heavy metal resistance metalloenzyme n=1 Tax=Pseudotenacibaculum sp. MALMAid0570 TaxID=3143938 RepID=UPI0032DFD5B1
MKRFHVHIRVKNLDESIQFYNTLFNTTASKVKSDYAKWMLEDPKVNFSISTGDGPKEIRHLGLQVETEKELEEVYEHMQKAEGQMYEEPQVTCCYAFSDKSWISDPQNIQWEVFHTHGDATVYGSKTSKECEIN